MLLKVDMGFMVSCALKILTPMGERDTCPRFMNGSIKFDSLSKHTLWDPRLLRA